MTANTKSKDGQEQSIELEATQGAMGAGNVDKIRDILFGNQMRDYERKFALLEERILREVAQLRDENRQRMDALESYVNQEIGSLNGRLKSEQKDRSEGDRKLSGEINDVGHGLEEKLSGVDEQFRTTGHELRQRILEQSKTLRDDLDKRYDEVTRFLERSTDQLREDKMDRSDLASMLTNLAMDIADGQAAKSDE